MGKNEIEIEPGIFISVITKKQWDHRTSVLKGDDLQFFIAKCNPAKLAPVYGRKKLYKVCEKLESEFNPETDYYVIRYAPQVHT